MSDARIVEHVKFFDHMVQLFPSSYYNPVIEDEGGAAEPTESNPNTQGDSDSEEDGDMSVTLVANRATSMSELREKLQAKVKALGQPREEKDEKPFKKRKGRKSRKLLGKEVKKQKSGTENKEKEKKTREENKTHATKEGSEPKKSKKSKIEGIKTEITKHKNNEQKPGKTQESKEIVNKVPSQAPAQKNSATEQIEKKQSVILSASKQQKKRKINDVSLGHDLMFSSVMQEREQEVDKAPGTSKKNPHRALRKVLHFEEKVKELKQQDPLLAHEVMKKAIFSTALSRAQGTKIHDDKARLAKALKRKEKSKKKSQKEWNERTKKVTASKMEVAQKRNENVKAKLDERSAHRLKKSIKKRGDIRALLPAS